MDKFTYSDDEDDSLDRLTLNVGGVKFETYVTTLQNISDTRLAWLTENVDPEILHTKEFFFDRHPGAFVHILNYYRTGKLHTPANMCGPAFEEELQFWGIDEKQMEPCCWEMFTKHREAESNLRSFEGPGFEDLRALYSRKVSTFSSFGPRKYLNIDFEKLWQILEDPHSSHFAKRFSIISCLMIVISVSLYCVGTMPSLEDNKVIQVFNYICLVFFTMEFGARIIVTPSRGEFLKDYKNWIDFVSLLPSYLLLIYPSSLIKSMVIIRILRVFKFFKLSYGLQVLIHTLKASSYELTLLLLILLIPVVIFSSLVHATENAFDKVTKFDSIPTTFWWCIVTITTVGYGDLYPVTWAGRIIGSVCSICGLLIVALPISVIGSNFTLYYAHVKARLKLPKKNRTLLQGNLRGLLRQPLSLSSRDRDRRTLRRNNNNAIRRKHEPVVSPSSFQLQLKRRKAFDQISGNTSDGFETSHTETCSSKYLSNDLITNENTNQPTFPSRGNTRRAALLAIELSDNESEISDCDVKVGLLRNSYVEEDATYQSLDDTKEASKKCDEILVELENSPNADDSVFDAESPESEEAQNSSAKKMLKNLTKNESVKDDEDNKNNDKMLTPRTRRRCAIALQTYSSSSGEESEGETFAAINSPVSFDFPKMNRIEKHTLGVESCKRVASESDLTDGRRRISMEMMTSLDAKSENSRHHKLLERAKTTHCSRNAYNNINVIMREAREPRNENGISIKKHDKQNTSNSNVHNIGLSSSRDENGYFGPLKRSHTLEPRNKLQPRSGILDNKVKSENDIREYKTLLSHHNSLKESGV